MQCGRIHGSFANNEEEILYINFETTNNICLLLKQNFRVVTLPKDFPQFVIVGSLYLLRQMNLLEMWYDLLYEGFVKRVRIMSMSKGFKGYFGITEDLIFNPECYEWKNLKELLLSYMAKKG